MSLSIPRPAQILLTSSLWTISTLMNIDPANTAESKSPFIFECSRDPQTRVHSTIIKYTNGKNQELIRWKSGVIKNPKQACRDASDRFESAWDNHQLIHLTTGSSQRSGMTIICAAADKKRTCNDNTKLFELLPGHNKDVVRTIIIKKINDKNNKLEPIWQSSGDEITIDLRQLIE